MKSVLVGSSPFRVEGKAVWCGQDLSVVIIGGTRPHIGAVAIATARASLAEATERSATASVLCVPGHQDDLPAREAALRLAKATGHTVSVAVGLHVDGAGNLEISRLMEHFQRVLSELEQQLRVRHNPI